MNSLIPVREQYKTIANNKKNAPSPKPITTAAMYEDKENYKLTGMAATLPSSVHIGSVLNINTVISFGQ